MVNKQVLSLVVVTNNRHKLHEINTIFLDFNLTIVSYRDWLGRQIEIQETGSTFRDNARLKVAPFLVEFPVIFLADDSGLEVDVLGGAPGVLSARYAPEGTSLALCEKVLRQLEGEFNRKARFRTVIALRDWTDQVTLVEGVVEGEIALEMRGDYGFGYDPIFIPEGFGLTFSEMPSEEKNKLSHRYRALLKAREVIMSLMTLT